MASTHSNPSMGSQMSKMFVKPFFIPALEDNNFVAVQQMHNSSLKWRPQTFWSAVYDCNQLPSSG